MQFLIGVDEAGRGALAGPVAVGVAMVPIDFDFGMVPRVKDSKMLTPLARERIYALARNLQKEKLLDFKVAMVGAGMIDRIGITRAVALATARALSRLSCDPAHAEVRLDGLLSAPVHFIHQQTIIRGDQTEPVISLASIMAKVTRDRYMVCLAKRYPAYDLARHKGYGTLVHRTCIAKNGLSDLHRKYFCKKIYTPRF
jgi:ribonuclease HII